MKRIYLLLSTLLIIYSLYACNRPTPFQPATNELAGTWVGTYQSKQIGSVPADQTPVSATATFQVNNQSLIASVYFTIYRQGGSPLVSPEPTLYSGTLNSHQVSMHISRFALCDPTRRNYILYFDGTLRGDTLTMVGQDTICPVQGWIYQQNLTLIRQ